MAPRKNFREPALLEKETGLYVTNSQLRHFLNRPNGMKLFEDKSEEWIDYQDQCYIWNFVYDLGEEDNSLYWDSKQERIRVKLDKKSKPYQYLLENGIDIEKYA